MDRHHQRDHRAHERKSKDSASHHKSNRHRRHEPERVEKRSSKVLARSDEKSRQHLEQSLVGPALSGDNDYVRRWLIQNEQEQYASDERSKGLERSQKREDILPKAHLGLGSFAHPQFGQEDSGGRRKSKQKHNSSSDSSLLEAPIPPKAQRIVPGEGKDDPPERGQQEPQLHKKRKAEPIEPDTASLSNQSSPLKETFEKRARHKTKEDRYEPKKKRRKSEKAAEKKRSTTKPKKKGDRKKAAKKAGEDLIRNFSSKSIGQERLTIRPSHGLGLFKNGRASSPAKRRGLPDLAFSEMEFLHHADRIAPGAKPDKITSKSREKEKRKATRAQDEISTFFKPTKTPLREIDPNIRGRASSTYTAREDSLYGRQFTADDYQHAHGRSRPLEATKKQASKFGQGSSSDRLSELRETSPGVNYPERPDSTSRISGNANTYITWSESQMSPGATVLSRQLKNANRQRSSTPESIRRSLQETGIYRDTGIHARPGLRTLEERSPEAERLQQQREPIHEEKTRRRIPRGGTSGTTTSPESPVTSSSNKYAGSLPSHRYQRTRSPRYEKIAETVYHNGETHEDGSGVAIMDGKKDAAMSGNQRIIVKHFDRELGWHRLPSSRAQKERHSADLRRGNEREAKSTPVNREQLAKLARIKRPATTLAVARSAGQENSKKNTPLVVDQQHMGPSAGASGDKQAAQRAFGGEQPISSSSGARNADEGEPALKDPQIEETVVTQPRFKQQQVEHGYPNVRFAEDMIAKEGFFVPSLVNPQSESKTQATMGVNPKETFYRTEIGSCLGLPVRGGWSTRASTPTFQPARRSPFIEPEPLFIHQVQRTLTPREDYLQYENQLKGGGFLNPAASNFESNLRFEDLPHDLPAYQGTEPFQQEETYDHPHDLLAYQENDFIQEQGDYDHQLYNYTYEEVEENSTAYAHETQIWEHEEGYVDEVENFEAHSGQDHLYRYETFEDVPGEEVFEPTEGPEQSYGNHADDGSYPTQGFWKSRHLY